MILRGLGDTDSGVTYDLWGNATPSTDTTTDQRYANWNNFVAQQVVNDETPKPLGVWDTVALKEQQVAKDLTNASGTNAKYYYIAGGCLLLLLVLTFGDHNMGEYDPEEDNEYHERRHHRSK